MSAAEDVARTIATARQPPGTAEVVDALSARYSEEEVLDALEHWHREIEAEEGVDGRWYWRGPPPPS
jgi:hypothetical protein